MKRHLVDKTVSWTLPMLERMVNWGFEICFSFASGGRHDFLLDVADFAVFRTMSHNCPSFATRKSRLGRRKTSEEGGVEHTKLSSNYWQGWPSNWMKQKDFFVQMKTECHKRLEWMFFGFFVHSFKLLSFMTLKIPLHYEWELIHFFSQ